MKRSRIVAAWAFGVVALAASLGLADDDKQPAARDTTPAAQTPATPAPAALATEPTSHNELYRKLCRRITIGDQEQTFAQWLERLQTELGATIEIDENVFNFKPFPNGKDPTGFMYKLQADEPVSVQWALTTLLQKPTYPVRTHTPAITLGEGGVRVIARELDHSRPVLVTYDLRSKPAYSTHLRAKFIEQAQREISPEGWGQPGGAWIIPGRSIYAVDVYHTPPVQEQIAELAGKDQFILLSGNSLPHGIYSPMASKPKPAEMEGVVQQLRADFPIESVAPRLMYEEQKRAARAPQLPVEIESRLAKSEQSAQAAQNHEHGRIAALRQLHSTEVEQFVNRAGNGMARMRSFEPSPSDLPLPPSPLLALPTQAIEPQSYEQPVPMAPGVAGWKLEGRAMPDASALVTMHESGRSLFAMPARNGDVRDRDHVVGFAAHALEHVPQAHAAGVRPEPVEHWVTRRLELVSLLKHATPMVYISDTVPRMEERKAARTRPLNDFEKASLPQLVEAQDVVAQGSVNRIEMLGAVRADNSCLECHQVQRGQLLGAFSYTLVRDPLLPPQPELAKPAVF